MNVGYRSCLLLAMAVGLTGCLSSPAGEPAEEPPAWAMPTPDLPYNAREGRALFAYYCAPCHGIEGRGDGFNAYNLDPKPRDLTDPDFRKQLADDDLLAVIRSGGGVTGLSNAMPPWGRTLNDRQIANLVSYLRTIPVGETESAESRVE